MTAAAAPGARRGFALALVLAALLLAGALAAGAVAAALQGTRDAVGAVARASALAAAERALTLAIAPSEWDSAWSAPAPPGLVAVRAHARGVEGDTVRVVRLDDSRFLVIAEARAGGPSSLAARVRLSLLVALDPLRRPRRSAAHSWSTMP